ncbi:MAG: hypothetical protein HRT61_13775 [Ekhidna sp.]|nr:hypothetical protein [Ekhidna sp.]
MRLLLLLIPLSLCLTFCKSAKTNAEEIRGFILLIVDGKSPSDLTAFSNHEMVDQKRVSKSQNQWMVKLNVGESTYNTILDELKKDSSVKQVSNMKSSETQNMTNKGHSKSKPNTKN